MSILWTIIIGFIAGVIAKFIMPGDNEPAGFILTAILGIVGAFVATFLGQALGWYGPGEGAGLIGAVVGAIIVLLVYGMVARRRRVVERRSALTSADTAQATLRGAALLTNRIADAGRSPWERQASSPTRCSAARGGPYPRTPASTSVASLRGMWGGCGLVRGASKH